MSYIHSDYMYNLLFWWNCAFFLSKMATLTNNSMVYRRTLYFYWMPNRVVQVMYTSRAVDMYHMIKRLKMSFGCQLYQWIFFLSCIGLQMWLCWSVKWTCSSWKTPRTDVDVFNVFYYTKTTAHTEADFP